MSRYIKLLALLCLFCGVGFASSATNYYFATAGSDGAAGTSTGTPWASISKFNSVFSSRVPGDSLLFNRGDVFVGALIISRSGSAGNDITIGAYGTGPNPIITGLVIVSSWTNLGSNIWESTSAVSSLGDLNLVLINGVAVPMGRTPNTGWFNVDSHTTVGGGQTGTITSTSIPKATQDWTGADLVMKVFNFSIVRNPITAHSSNTLTWQATDGEDANDNYGFFIENHLATLDQQNEWYYNPSTGKVDMYSVGSPGGTIQVATMDTLVYNISRDYIHYVGVDFIGSNRRAFFIGSSDSILIQNCKIDKHGLYGIWGANNFGDTALALNVNHCYIGHTGSQGIVLGGEFKSAYIGYDSVINTGMTYGSFKVPVLNSGKTSVWPNAYGAIYLHDNPYPTVEYCTIDSSGNAGIWSNNYGFVFQNNQVSHTQRLVQDGGGVYCQGWRSTAQVGTGRIHKNIIHDGIGDSSGVPSVAGKTLSSGIYIDENNWNVHVDSNVCYRMSLNGIFSNSNTQCYFGYNKCFDNGSGQFLFSSKFRATRPPGTYQEQEITDTAIGNIGVAKKGTSFNEQFAVNLSTRYSTIDSFFTRLDSNIYTRPIDEATSGLGPINIAFTNFPGSATFSHYILSQWKTYALTFTNITGTDVNAGISPVTPITDTLDLIVVTNPSQSPLTLSLPFNYKDMRNVQHNGTITLQPYTGEILVKFGPATNVGTFIKLYGNKHFHNF